MRRTTRKSAFDRHVEPMEIGLVVILLMVAAFTALQGLAEPLLSEPTYSLVAELRGEASILDHDQSLDDCLGAAQAQRGLWGTDVAFRCELEG